MSMLDHAPRSVAAGRGAFLPAFGAFLLRTLVDFMKARKGRSHVVYMRDFDDAQLADIGLKRSDVESALQLPLSSDPSHYLVRARQNPLCGIKRF